MEHAEQAARPPIWVVLLVSAGYALLLIMPTILLGWLRPYSIGREATLFPPFALGITLAAAALCAGGAVFVRSRDRLRGLPLRTRSLLFAPIPFLAAQQALFNVARTPAASFALILITAFLAAILIRDLRKHSLPCAALYCPLLLWMLAMAAQRYIAAMMLP